MIQKKIKNLLHSTLRLFNYDLVKCPYGDLRKRMELVRQYDVRTIFDVGANIGEFGAIMRESGYKHRIISFEPRKKAFAELLKNTSNDMNWECVNIGLGMNDGIATINIAGNETSSSLLEMNKLHSDIKPHSGYVSSEEITVRKIDSVIFDYIDRTEKMYLKIDTQGYEKQILQGAMNSLASIQIIQLEMSLVELYKGSELIYEMIPFLENKGFFLSSIERGFHDKKTGRLLQVDGIFIKMTQV